MSVSKSDAFPGGLPEIIGLGSSSLVLTGLKKRRINLMFTGYKEKLQTTLIDYICILHNANLAGKKKKSNLSTFLCWVQCSLGMGDCYVLPEASNSGGI